MKALTYKSALVIALFPAFGTAPESKNPVELVARLQSKYEGIQSFSAKFEQIFQGHNVQLHESGMVMMKKPGKMYWEYRHPSRKLFVADGKRSYFYVPRDHQVIVSDLDLSSAQTPLLFLMGKGNLAEDFQVELEEDEQALETGNVLLRLTPRHPQGEFARVILEINPTSFLIHRLVVIEPIGNRNEYILTDWRENARIPEGKFEFEVPPGVDVIQQ